MESCTFGGYQPDRPVFHFSKRFSELMSIFSSDPKYIKRIANGNTGRPQSTQIGTWPVTGKNTKIGAFGRRRSDRPVFHFSKRFSELMSNFSSDSKYIKRIANGNTGRPQSTQLGTWPVMGFLRGKLYFWRLST